MASLSKVRVTPSSSSPAQVSGRRAARPPPRYFTLRAVYSGGGLVSRPAGLGSNGRWAGLALAGAALDQSQANPTSPRRPLRLVIRPRGINPVGHVEFRPLPLPALALAAGEEAFGVGVRALGRGLGGERHGGGDQGGEAERIGRGGRPAVVPARRDPGARIADGLRRVELQLEGQAQRPGDLLKSVGGIPGPGQRARRAPSRVANSRRPGSSPPPPKRPPRREHNTG